MRRQQRSSMPVRRAMASPSGIIAAGAATGLSLVAGLPLGVAVGVGGAAWLVRVVVALPSAVRLRGERRPDLVDPFTVGEPWRAFVLGARQSSRRYGEAVGSVPAGPLKDRLAMVGTRVETATVEMGQIARSGHQLTAARRRIDTPALRRQLESDPAPAPTVAQALQAQLDTAVRLDSTIEATRGRLEVTTAQLGHAVARAVEIAATSNSSVTLSGVESDLAALVDEMESLRQALVETSPPPSPGSRPGPELPPTEPS